jgi:putative phosphoribosyl transferase
MLASALRTAKQMLSNAVHLPLPLRLSLIDQSTAPSADESLMDRPRCGAYPFRDLWAHRATTKIMPSFHDRTDAGRKLAEKLTAYAGRTDVIVLALPRGGVPVAFEVARRLKAPMDILVVRKLGTPGHEELAMGAVASGGVRVLNDEVLASGRISKDAIRSATEREREELERRERTYRGQRTWPDLRDRIVIVVDDGIATGSTMRAAVEALRLQHPAKVIVAVPVAAPDTYHAFQSIADEMVAVMTPDFFRAVGLWYDDFEQTSDEEVRELLGRVAMSA